MKHSGINPALLPARNQAEIARDLYGGKAAPIPSGCTLSLPAAQVRCRLRQSQKPILNQLELAFLANLLTRFRSDQVLSQAVRLELGRGIWYKPDFFIPPRHSTLAIDLQAIAFEVKGPRAFRGGFENLKVAARVHPWVTFFLVWRESGVWREQQVLP